MEDSNANRDLCMGNIVFVWFGHRPRLRTIPTKFQPRHRSSRRAFSFSTKPFEEKSHFIVRNFSEPKQINNQRQLPVVPSPFDGSAQGRPDFSDLFWSSVLPGYAELNLWHLDSLHAQAFRVIAGFTGLLTFDESAIACLENRLTIKE